MTVSPYNAKRAALLRDVAAACRESMDKDRQRVDRAEAMYAISIDPRLHSKARHTQASLIDDVMQMFHTSRPNARVIIHRARKV